MPTQYKMTCLIVTSGAPTTSRHWSLSQEKLDIAKLEFEQILDLAVIMFMAAITFTHGSLEPLWCLTIAHGYYRTNK